MVGSASQWSSRSFGGSTSESRTAWPHAAFRSLAVLLVSFGLVVVSLANPHPVGAQDADPADPAAETDDTDLTDSEAPAEDPADQLEPELDSVLVPGSPTTEVDPDAEVETVGDGVSVAREESQNGIKPSSVVTLIIVALLVVGLALALLTLAYWFRTRPSKNKGGRSKKGRRSRDASNSETSQTRAVSRDAESNGVAPAATGAVAAATVASGAPTASASGRPAASEPTVTVPAVSVDQSSAHPAVAPISRSRPKRSEKADRAALVQRVRDEGAGSIGESDLSSDSFVAAADTSSADTSSAKSTNGTKPTAEPKRGGPRGPEDPMVELSLED